MRRTKLKVRSTQKGKARPNSSNQIQSGKTESIQVESNKPNWVKRPTYNELNSLSLFPLMWSLTFDAGLGVIECMFYLFIYPALPLHAKKISEIWVASKKKKSLIWQG